MREMISLSHVYKIYSGSTYALRNINLRIKKGDFVFLTGPSGSGKTSLFRIMSATLRVTSGSVQVFDFDLNRMKEREIPYYRRKIGVVYQDFRLLNDRSVYENVELPLKIQKERTRSISLRVREVLDHVGLFCKMHNFPRELSGGEQQRVAIARALVHHPILLIADEPTGNLDPDLSQEIMDLLKMVNSQGTTVFVASHNLNLIHKLSKRVIQIQNGQIQKEQIQKGGILEVNEMG